MTDIPDPFRDMRRTDDRRLVEPFFQQASGPAKPNPHVSFGFGPHLCLGAAHSRTVLRALLTVCCDEVRDIRVLEADNRVEHAAAYTRPLGFDSLLVAMEPA